MSGIAVYTQIDFFFPIEFKDLNKFSPKIIIIIKQFVNMNCFTCKCHTMALN